MTAERRDQKRTLINRILPRRESKAFGSIEIYPREIHFKTQNPGERVYVLVRAHVLTNFGWIVRSVSYFVVPLLVLVLFEVLEFDVNTLPSDIITFGLMAYYLIVMIFAISNLLKWYYNIYLVTSDRILHYRFRPMSTYKISEAEIDNIQDVSQSSIGFLPNLFGYGDILVQTASKQNKFYFKNVPRPIWFRDVITDLSRLVRTNEP